MQCPTSLNLASTSNPSDDISTSAGGTIIKQVNSTTGTIIANNKITGTTTKVNYKAGKFIQLDAGFKADNGTVFTAEMGGCQ